MKEFPKGIVKGKDLALLSDSLHSLGRHIVSTNGCFDILHAGHVSYLEAARALGDVLVLGLNSDASVRRLKGPHRPLNSELNRATVMAALRSIDYVVIFDEQTPAKFIETLKPNIHVKGGDYDESKLPELSSIKKVGAQLKLLPFVEGLSTTSLIKSIKETSA